MNELAAEAFERWKEAGHPGWSVTEADSHTFLEDLHQYKVGHYSVLPCPALPCPALPSLFK